MSMKQRFFFYGFLVTIIGIFIGTTLPLNFVLSLLFALISIFLIKHKFASVLILVLSLSILISGLSYTERTKTYKNISLTGTVCSTAISESSSSMILKDCEFNGIRNTKVCVYSQNIDTSIKEGNVLTVYGDAFPANLKNSNPGEADFTFSKDIGYVFKARSFTIIDDKCDISYHFRLFRDSIRRTLFSAIDNSGSASVLYAMATGDKSYIKQDVVDVFASCGTSHLLAVSGLHVGILLNVLIFFLERIKFKKSLTLFIIGGVVILYSAFTGFSSSVLRASIMALALQSSNLFGAKYDPLNSLSFAGMLILFFDPLRLYDVAFQLSFCACFGIIWIMKYSCHTEHRIFDTVINSALVTIGATLFTLPLQLYYFGTVSTISILANILLVPISSFALMLTFLLLPIAIIFPKTALILKIPGYIMEGVIYLSEKLSYVPGVSFKPISICVTILLLALMIFFTPFIRANFKRTVAAILLLIMPFLFIGNEIYINNTVTLKVPAFEGETLTVHIEDDKHYIVGLYEDSLNSQINYFSRNIGKIDVLILTTSEQVEILPDAIEKGLSFESLYVAHDVALNHSAKQNGAKHVKTILTKSGYFEVSNNSAFYHGEKIISIGKNNNKDCDIAISLDPLTEAPLVITKNVGYNNKNLYDIDICGYTEITFRSN